MKEYKLNIKVGDEVEVGRFRNVVTKIKAIETLIIKGIKEIRTDNEINNPMYKINEKLGFYAVPSSLEYLKTID